MTEREAKKELMRRALEITPTVHVGKEGLTENVAAEIAAQLKKNRLIKVRVLPSTETETEDMASSIVSETGGVAVDVRGGVIILTDKRTWTSLSQKKF